MKSALCVCVWRGRSDKDVEVASFPGPQHFRLRGGPGIFPHVRDVNGGKDLIECGRSGAQNSKKRKR